MEDELQDNIINPKELQDRSLQRESHARRARAVYLAEQRKEETVKAEPVVKDPGKGPEPVADPGPLTRMPEEPTTPLPELPKEPEEKKPSVFLRKYIGSGNTTLRDNDPTNDTFGILALEAAERDTGLSREEILRLAGEQGLQLTSNFRAQYSPGGNLYAVSSANIPKEDAATPFLRNYAQSNPSITDNDPTNDTFGIQALEAAERNTGLSRKEILDLAQKQGMQLTTNLRQQYNQYGGNLSKISSANISAPAPKPTPAPTPSRSTSIYTPAPSRAPAPSLISFASGNPANQDNDRSNDSFGVQALNAAKARTGMSESQILNLARQQGLNLTTNLKAQISASSRSIY